MGIFSTLFGKRPQHQPAVDHIVHQAMDTFERWQSLVSDSVHNEMTLRIKQLRYDLVAAAPGGGGVTSVRLQAMMCALAQSIGLMVYEYWGKLLPQDHCIKLAQANTTIERYIQRKNVPPSNWAHACFTEMIEQQLLARQTSMPIAISFMGQYEMAQRMAHSVVNAAKLPTDVQIEKALAAIDEV